MAPQRGLEPRTQGLTVLPRVERLTFKALKVLYFPT